MDQPLSPEKKRIVFYNTVLDRRLKMAVLHPNQAKWHPGRTVSHKNPVVASVRKKNGNHNCFPTSPSARLRSKSFVFALYSWILASIRASDSLVNGRNVGRSSSVCGIQINTLIPTMYHQIKLSSELACYNKFAIQSYKAYFVLRTFIKVIYYFLNTLIKLTQ